MSEALGWILPALVVFGSAALVVAAVIITVRYRRRSPKAVSLAHDQRAAAGSALLRLDDAVAELDLEAELSGALYDGTAPQALRRARITAAHVRDEAFDTFARVNEGGTPADIRRASRRIVSRVTEAEGVVRRAREEHGEWVSKNVSAKDQLAAVRQRINSVRSELGETSALLRELGERFDESEFADAALAAPRATEALTEAEDYADAAEEVVFDPARSALAELAGAERALRRARAGADTFHESHRVVTEAASAAPAEWKAAREALREATTLRDKLDAADDAERLGAELRTIEAGLSTQRGALERRPATALREIAVLRDRLDLAVGDARTAQQRLRNARSALTGALSAARASVAHAETTATGGSEAARLRLASAQRELAAATGATDDPVGALDAARRATRHAEDAVALADYAKLSSRRG